MGASTDIFMSVRNGIRILQKENFQEFWDHFKMRTHSNTQTVGLRRDVTQPFRNPDAEIDISICLLEEEDIYSLIGTNDPDKLDSNLLRYQLHLNLLRYQLHLIEEDIPICFVAVNDEGKAVYMQWLIRSKPTNTRHV